MKTSRERAEDKRQEKLSEIRVQVAKGSLVIRPMTDAERLRYPYDPLTPRTPKYGRAR